EGRDAVAEGGVVVVVADADDRLALGEAELLGEAGGGRVDHLFDVVADRVVGEVAHPGREARRSLLQRRAHGEGGERPRVVPAADAGGEVRWGGAEPLEAPPDRR